MADSYIIMHTIIPWMALGNRGCSHIHKTCLLKDISKLIIEEAFVDESRILENPVKVIGLYLPECAGTLIIDSRKPFLLTWIKFDPSIDK